MYITRGPRKPKRLRIKLIIILLAIITIATVTYLFLNKTAPKKTATTNTSLFSFDNASLPDWTSGGTNHITPEDIKSNREGSNIPTASTIIHLKDMGDPSNCFVILSYKTDNKNPASELNTFNKPTISASDLSYREIATKPITMKTSEGNKSYQLHQYSIEGDPKTSMLRATEYGYFSIGDGYMDIRGNCTKFDQLGKTIPVLSSATFNLK